MNATASTPAGKPAPIRSKPCPKCIVCDSAGSLLHEGIQDALFGCAGEWNVKRCTDPGCGMLWLDPMPAERDLGRAYETYYTHESPSQTAPLAGSGLKQRIKESYWSRTYGYETKTSPAWTRFYFLAAFLDPPRRAGLDYNVMYLPREPRGRLLEVGCGSGWMLKQLRERGWEVEGLDFDRRAVDQARKEGLAVRLGSLQEVRYAAGRFDAIVMSHVIEHVHDPAGLISECRRVLRNGGRLVLITPNAWSLGHRLFGRHWRGLEPPRHLHVFSPAALRSLAGKIGWKSLAVRTTIRDADKYFESSRSIRGAHGGKPAKAIPDRTGAIARGLRWLEWAALKGDKNLGEELVLIAEK